MEQNQTLLLTQAALGAAPSLQTIEDLKEKLAELSTEDLAKGYAKLKPFEKTLDAVVKATNE